MWLIGYLPYGFPVSTGGVDHIVAERREGNTAVALISNSWGASSGADYDPYHPINVSTWFAHQAGMLPVFSAGNDGPEPNTLNDYAKGPHVLGVSATDSEQNVVDFSSHGRTPEHENANYDRHVAYENASALYGGTHEDELDGPVGIYRIGVGAKGEDVMSTLSPYDPLQVVEPDEELDWYGLMSGTSMSCPITSGCATLVIDAYLETEGELPNPMDLLYTLEAEADIAEDADPAYTPYNMGTGFVNARDAVTRVADGNYAAFDGPRIDQVDVTTASTGTWSDADVEWAVSHPAGALDSVTSELLVDGNAADSETTAVSGSSAAGEHELRSRAEPDEIRLTVTDDAGTETTVTRDY